MLPEASELRTLVSLRPLVNMAGASQMEIAATMLLVVDSSPYSAPTPPMGSLVCVGRNTVCKENT